MATISKAAVNRGLISRTVTSALRTQGPAMAQVLVEHLYPGLPPSGLSMEQFLEDLADYLEQSTERASEMSSQVLTEAAQDVHATQAVSEATEAMLDEVQWQRSQLEGTYGRAVAAHFGFAGTLPRSTDPLIELSGVLEDRLRKNALPTQTRRGRPALDRVQIADQLAGARAKLEAAAGQNVRETRETQQARQARDTALDDWNADYRGVATIAVGLFQLARMPALAERVRPTARRRKQLPDPIDLQGPGELDASADAPVGDAPVVDLPTFDPPAVEPDLEEQPVD